MSGFYVGDWGACSKPVSCDAPRSHDWEGSARTVSIEPEKDKRIDCVTTKQLQLAIDQAIARIKFPEPRTDREIANALAPLLMPLLGLPIVFPEAPKLPEPNTLELRDAFGKTILPKDSRLPDRYVAYEVGK